MLQGSYMQTYIGEHNCDIKPLGSDIKPLRAAICSSQVKGYLLFIHI